MNYLNKLLIICLSILLITIISCSEHKIEKKNLSTPPKEANKVVENIFVDPTKSLSNEELRNYDSLFNATYSEKLNRWKNKYEDSLNCEIVFHTARDGNALCINFINFTDTAIYSLNLDDAIYDISETELSLIEVPLNYIHTRRIMTWEATEKYDLRFSGADYQQYQLRSQ
jgi:hypothetical protein